MFAAATCSALIIINTVCHLLTKSAFCNSFTYSVSFLFFIFLNSFEVIDKT